MLSHTFHLSCKRWQRKLKRKPIADKHASPINAVYV